MKIELERFESKYIPEPNTGCWLWTDSLRRDGYGQFKLNGSMLLAHRVSYELYVGPIPDGLDLDHVCHNNSGCLGGPCIHRACVNWQHLEPVTNEVNVKRSPNTRASKNIAATHCPKGHPYDEANTRIQKYTSKRGYYVIARVCIVCARAAVREWCERNYKRVYERHREHRRAYARARYWENKQLDLG